MFHTFVAVMAMLTFSMPFIILAQQNSVRTEVSEAVAAHDINAVNLEARAAAEQDAINDVNKLSWFVTGCAASSVGGLVGALASNSTGTLIAAAGALVPLIWIHTYEPNLPPNRFIGKSPEYIDFYTNAYRKQAKRLRTVSALGGCIVGCIGVSLGFSALFIWAIGDEGFYWF